MENVKEKILLLLLGGMALGLCYTPYQQSRVLRGISKEWRKLSPEWNELSPQKLKRDIDALCRYNFISKTKKEDGSIKFFLTEKGRWRALKFQLENIRNKKVKWDGKWRMVAFDVPEKHRGGRDALRYKLKAVGFCELQKSVLVTPYDCEKEISELVKFFELGRYIRFGVLESLDNEERLKKFFKLV